MEQVEIEELRDNLFESDAMLTALGPEFHPNDQAEMAQFKNLLTMAASQVAERGVPSKNSPLMNTLKRFVSQDYLRAPIPGCFQTPNPYWTGLKVSPTPTLRLLMRRRGQLYRQRT
jgi:hypothetical protein